MLHKKKNQNPETTENVLESTLDCQKICSLKAIRNLNIKLTHNLCSPCHHLTFEIKSQGLKTIKKL